LGRANLTHGGGLARDFGKIISIFSIGFVSFLKHPYIRFGSPEPSTMPKIHGKLKLAFAWLLLCVGSLIFPAPAGAAGPSGLPFIVDVWTSKEGLPGNVVISVIQTRDGYLWLGTLNGLVRFDGNHFTVFNEYNTPGLNSDRIVYLFEDSHTNLWIGTDTAGLVLVKDGNVKSFDIGRAGHEGRIVYAYEDLTGCVWFYTADGRTSRFQDVKMNTDPSLISRELVLRAAKVLIPGQSGSNWRMQMGRVQKWRNNQRERDLGVYPWRVNTIVTSACEDSDGNLIVGTLGEGVFWLGADGNWRHISTEQGLSSAFVLSLCMDREGSLWVGTDGEGLDRIKRKTFSTSSEHHSWVVQSISGDEAGGLWTAFNAHGVTFWFTNSAQDFGVGQGSNAWTVLVDRKQQIWVGTRGEGLFQFQTNHFQAAPGAEILGQQIFALFEDRAGQLWVGTQNGLARWNGQDWKIYTTHDGLSENIVRAIAEDAEGNLWIGTESQGLNLFKAGKFNSIQAAGNGLPGNDISCLYLDQDGVLWVGTSGHGLARFYQGKWARYSTDNGLASNSIDYIIEDDAGCLWIGSNAGLMRIQKKSLNDFANGTVDFLSCRTYVETDGLPTRECSAGSQPAACRTHDGRLWFPTTKGLVSVNPADLKPNRQPPLVMIESVRVGGQEQKTNRFSPAWSRSVTIPPGHEQLEIHYTALNFPAPREVQFKYRLEGHETAWTEAGDTRVAYYNKVPPGNYRFHIIARNEDGVWNEAGDALEVTVQPQFWQTWWFRTAVILGLVGTVIAVVRYLSTQKLRRQLQQQASLEKERSRIARDLHDQLGANLTQVGLLGEMAEADKNSPAEIESHAQQISQTARETTRSLDEIVWAVNPSNDTLEGLVNYACKYAQEYLALAGLRYRADVPAQLPAITIPPEVRHNIFLTFKEAVNNVVKHAQASEVRVRLQLQPGNFALSIEDNGRGLGGRDANAAPARNGLRNMRKRMKDIHGEFSISPGTGGGTIVCLTIPFGKTV
jgi:ligand-binding sensor domain-containing protein/signal transduction histidine kinase